MVSGFVTKQLPHQTDLLSVLSKPKCVPFYKFRKLTFEVSSLKENTTLV